LWETYYVEKRCEATFSQVHKSSTAREKAIIKE